MPIAASQASSLTYRPRLRPQAWPAAAPQGLPPPGARRGLPGRKEEGAAKDDARADELHTTTCAHHAPCWRHHHRHPHPPVSTTGSSCHFSEGVQVFHPLGRLTLGGGGGLGALPLPLSLALPPSTGKRGWERAACQHGGGDRLSGCGSGGRAVPGPLLEEAPASADPSCPQPLSSLHQISSWTPPLPPQQQHHHPASASASAGAGAAAHPQRCPPPLAAWAAARAAGGLGPAAAGRHAAWVRHLGQALSRGPPTAQGIDSGGSSSAAAAHQAGG